jgi:Protein of unknown function with PCYCGC motif
LETKEIVAMRVLQRVAVVLALLAGGIALAAVPSHRLPRLQPQAEEPIPAFHAQAPKAELPATMSPSLFTEVAVQNAYVIAARIKKTLYQEPCYCHCDQSQGHGSLLDCYVSRHASGCDICMREDFYAYEQLAKGKTGAQIREAIVKGEWQSVDVTKYQKPLSSK